VLIERALDLLLEHALKKRFAQTRQPRSSKTSDSEGGGKSEQFAPIEIAHQTSARVAVLHCSARCRVHIPNAVKRQIAGRDGLRCTHVSRRVSLRSNPIHSDSPRGALGTRWTRERRQSTNLVRVAQSFARRAGLRPGVGLGPDSRAAWARCANVTAWSWPAPHRDLRTLCPAHAIFRCPHRRADQSSAVVQLDGRRWVGVSSGSRTVSPKALTAWVVKR